MLTLHQYANVIACILMDVHRAAGHDQGAASQVYLQHRVLRRGAGGACEELLLTLCAYHCLISMSSLQLVPALQFNPQMDACTVPCDQVGSLPAITFELDSILFAVPSSAWVSKVPSDILKLLQLSIAVLLIRSFCLLVCI